MNCYETHVTVSQSHYTKCIEYIPIVVIQWQDINLRQSLLYIVKVYTLRKGTPLRQQWRSRTYFYWDHRNWRTPTNHAPSWYILSKPCLCEESLGLSQGLPHASKCDWKIIIMVIVDKSSPPCFVTCLCVCVDHVCVREYVCVKVTTSSLYA